MENTYILAKDISPCIKKYFGNDDLISVNELLCVLEELDFDIEKLKEEIEDIKKDIEDNYEPIPVHKQYEIYDSDFI